MRRSEFTAAAFNKSAEIPFGRAEFEQPFAYKKKKEQCEEYNVA
jgi:hypothetical protein